MIAVSWTDCATPRPLFRIIGTSATLLACLCFAEQRRQTWERREIPTSTTTLSAPDAPSIRGSEVILSARKANSVVSTEQAGFSTLGRERDARQRRTGREASRPQDVRVRDPGRVRQREHRKRHNNLPNCGIAITPFGPRQTVSLADIKTPPRVALEIRSAS